MGKLSVLSDAPVAARDDLLEFDRYLEPILAVLVDPEARTPFTIGVFGAWGSGKSSLLAMVDDALREDYPDRFVRVHFDAWLHRKEENMLAPLLHALRDTLEEDKCQRFVEAAARIGTVLLRLGADVLLKTLTADTVCLEDLEKHEEQYIRAKHRAESELRNLRTTLQQQFDKVGEAGGRVVLFIDNLDRCEPAELVDLLESVKLFLDLRNVFVILAVDKEVIDRGIEIRYSKFKFAGDRSAAIGAEFLEKLVQLPLQMFPLHPTQVERYIDSLCQQLNPPTALLEQRALLARLCIANPRKVKRILNILTVAIGMTHRGAQIDAALIVRLTVLQLQAAELYYEVARQPDLLLALESVYAGKLAPSNLEAFAKYGTRRKEIAELCDRWHQPNGPLAALFDAAGFDAHRARLPDYISMLGT